MMMVEAVEAVDVVVIEEDAVEEPVVGAIDYVSVGKMKLPTNVDEGEARKYFAAFP
jgi:hypothetical protein